MGGDRLGEQGIGIESNRLGSLCEFGKGRIGDGALRLEFVGHTVADQESAGESTLGRRCRKQGFGQLDDRQAIDTVVDVGDPAVRLDDRQ